MSYVRKKRGAGVASDLYEHILSESDVQGYSPASPGRRCVQLLTDAVVDPGDANSYTFTLPFQYLVGANQLIVGMEQGNDFLSTDILHGGFSILMDSTTLGAHVDFNDTVDPYYEEIDSTTIKIFNMDNLIPSLSTEPGARFLFMIPHTSAPGERTDSVIVNAQGSGVGVELLGNGDGLVLRSDNGGRFLFKIDNSGHITTKQI